MALGFKKGEIVILVIPNNKYSSKILEVSKYFSKNFKASCYVSLNKPINTLMSSLKKSKVKADNFLVIDGITKSANPKAEIPDNCICVSSASALTEMSIAIKQTIKTGQFEGLLFDSLSTLLIYNKSGPVGKFAHDLVNKIKAQGMTAVFTALKGDTDSQLLKEMGLFVDKVINLK